MVGWLQEVALSPSYPQGSTLQDPASPGSGAQPSASRVPAVMCFLLKRQGYLLCPQGWILLSDP